MKKKLLSTLLAVAMVLSLLPVGAFAADAIAITLPVEGLATGSVMPAATTDVNGVALTTTWKAADAAEGTEGTEANGTATFDTAGTYVATITATGDAVADATFTLNGETATAENGTLTKESVTVAADGKAITIADDIQHGSVTTSPAGAAAANATVTVTATPDEGYVLDAISVVQTENTGTTVNVTEANTFEMPDAAVTVSATFTAEQPQDQEITAVEISLDTTAIDQGADLPEPTITTTPTNGADVSVTWTLNGTEVSDASEAGEYTATFEVTPKAGFKLADGVTYKVNNQEAQANALTATLTVNEVTPTDITAVEISLDTTAIDQGANLPEPTITTTPAGGADVSVTWTLNGTEVSDASEAGEYTATFEVTPKDGFKLADGVTYKVNNQEAQANALTATLTVNEVTPTDITAVEISLDTTAIDQGADLPEPTITTTPAGGADVSVTWTLNGTEVSDASEAGEYTATFEVTPKAGFKLADGVTYKVNNQEAQANALTATLTVNEVTPTDITAVEIALDTTAIDQGADLPVPTITTTPADGADVSVTWTLDGTEVSDASEAGEYTATFTVTPRTGFKLADGVTYKVNNQEVQANALTATLTVNESQTTPTDITAVEIALDTTAIDQGADLPVPTITTTPANGADVSVTWTVDNETVTTASKAGEYTATFSVTPKTGFKLADGVTYKVNNQEVQANTLTATLTVNESTTPPEQDKVISSVEITLVPAAGIKVGDLLPQATTTTEGVKILSTAWTAPDGTEVTGTSPVASAAGKYSATIKVDAETGYVLTGASYKIDGVTVTPTAEEITLTKEVTVEAAPVTKYDVTVNDTPSVGGTASANVKTAAEGETVTVTITPDEGYKVLAVTKNGVAVEVTGNTFTFTMPADDVVILVTFEKATPDAPSEDKVDAVVTPDVTVDSDGATSTTVTETQVTTAIDKAIEEAKKENPDLDDNASVGNITIPATSTSGNDEKVTVTLPDTAVKTLVKAEKVTIETNVGTVALPQEVLTKQKDDGLKLVVEKAETSVPTTTAKVEHAFEVKVEKAAGGEVKIKDLKAPIELRFTIAKNLDAKKVMLAYWDTAAKAIKRIKSSVYDPSTGIISGSITHLTEIVVVDPSAVSDYYVINGMTSGTGGAGKTLVIKLNGNYNGEQVVTIAITRTTGGVQSVEAVTQTVNAGNQEVSFSYSGNPDKIDVYVSSGMPALTEADLGVEIYDSATK